MLWLWLLPSAPASTAPFLKDVTYTDLPGNRVGIELQLSGAVKPPQVFATDQPARIVLDLAGVGNGLAGKRIPIGIGPVRDLAAVAANKRTRVVINLSSPVDYRVNTQADKIAILLKSPRATPTPPRPPSGSPAAPPRSHSGAPGGGGANSKSAPPGRRSPTARKPRSRPSGQGIDHSGNRISLNFQDIEVRAVLQLLADFVGFNLVASDTVTGNITLRLKDIPWEQALDIILKSKGLSMRKTGNIILVAPTLEMVRQKEAELQADRKIQELTPLHSAFIQVNYARAKELTKMLKSEKNQLLSARGNVTFDERTNTLLVQDTEARLADIRRLIRKLDVPVRQVMIESRVVIANDDFARDLGVRFGLSRWQESIGGGRFNELTGAVQGHIAGTAGVHQARNSALAGVGTIQIPNSTVPLLVNLPAANPTSGVNFLLGKVGSYLLQLELTAMQREGRGEIISSPRVITSDNQEAIIKVGQEIPYQEQQELGRTTVAFKEAVLELKVTPRITPDDRVIIRLEVKKDNADFTREVQGVPPIDTRSVETSVLVDNGETLVLGGVFERVETLDKHQVPWLGDLPLVGRFFRSSSRRDNKNELLIFVTPRILKTNAAKR
ncbi:MAG: type IV pilus secretin PilQ [Candidatus Thiosymbion ectosymbiont of Robbea hypermnestra]|nr:type IV pilus secretin PilQ [Candidatus Thiosymbion ectosymbiont of Robbea hypermnestra]